MPVEIMCKLERCKKVFPVKPSQALTKKYCSRACMAEGYTKERLKKNCESCGEGFEVYDNEYQENARFCSTSCSGKGSSGEKSIRYKHGIERQEMLDAQKARRKKYYENNREVCYQRSFLGKAKRRKLIGESGHTFLQWIGLLRKYDNCCCYCNVRMTKKMGIHQRTRDHIIALERGGSDYISNIVPACRSCNSSKGTKTYEEWKGVKFTPKVFEKNGKFDIFVIPRNNNKPECSVKGCVRKASSILGKFCVMHRNRLKKTGETGVFYSLRNIHLSIEKPKCSVEGCVNKTITFSAELCSMHYTRKLRTGEIGVAYKLKTPKGFEKPKCSIEGCVEKVRCKNLCSMHYTQHLSRVGSKCSIEGCESAILAKSYCSKHYGQQRVIGEVGLGIKCSVDGCDRASVAKTYCGFHHRRLLKNGVVGSPKSTRDRERRIKN